MTSQQHRWARPPWVQLDKHSAQREHPRILASWRVYD